MAVTFKQVCGVHISLGVQEMIERYARRKVTKTALDESLNLQIRRELEPDLRLLEDCLHEDFQAWWKE